MTDQTQGANGADTGADTGGGLPSAADILAFDPFGPAENSDSTAGAADAKPADDKGGEPGKTPAPAAATPPLKAGETVPLGADGKPLVDPNAAPAAPATTPQAQPTANLEQLIRDQTAAITTALNKPAEPAAKTEEPPPKYNLGLPPEVIGLLRSEDEGEFAKGMHTVINGISNRLWADFQTHIGEVIQQRVPALLNEQNSARTEQEKVATDFYGKYENLRNEALQPLIQSIGLQISNERTATGKSNAWSAEIRDEIAERIFTAIPALRPAAAPQAQTPPGGTGAKKPPFASGAGARPDATPDASAEFRELLG